MGFVLLFIVGVAGISKAQEIVENYLLGFYNSTYPAKTPSGNFSCLCCFCRGREKLFYVCQNLAAKNRTGYPVAKITEHMSVASCGLG